MMKKDYIDTNINIKKLGLLLNTFKELEKNNIDTIAKLVKTKKNSLKNVGFSNEQIKEIEVKLQLNGLDLNGNKY